MTKKIRSHKPTGRPPGRPRKAPASNAEQRSRDLTRPTWDSDDLAYVVHATRRSVERWRREGSGPPFIRANGKILYDPESVRAWLRQREVTSTSAPASP